MECEFAPISCPNSIDCPPLLRLQLKEHLNKCLNTPCDHVKHGFLFFFFFFISSKVKH